MHESAQSDDQRDGYDAVGFQSDAESGPPKPKFDDVTPGWLVRLLTYWASKPINRRRMPMMPIPQLLDRRIGLPQQARDMALAAWSVDIHNQWGSVEIGVAGSEGNSFSGMTLAEEFLIFAAVDEHDEPVEDAAAADRLLVTKLYGNVMPMIRYELTDTVVIDSGPNPDAPGYRRITDVKAG